MMRKLILATLPTVGLHKLKIVQVLQIDFFNVNVNNGVHSVSNDVSSALSYLDDRIFYLLKNESNPNIDLLIDGIITDMLDIANNYFDTEVSSDCIEDGYFNNSKDFVINEHIIRHEVRQLLNDISLLNIRNDFNNNISSIKLLLPDGVMFDIRD